MVERYAGSLVGMKSSAKGDSGEIDGGSQFLNGGGKKWGGMNYRASVERDGGDNGGLVESRASAGQGKCK